MFKNLYVPFSNLYNKYSADNKLILNIKNMYLRKLFNTAPKGHINKMFRIHV